MNIKIATRRSKLAQVQTELVISMLKEKQNIQCEKLLVETEGDRKLDVTLDKIGGKGLFVKDIEIALMKNRAQAAVHSLKDVPYEISDMFEIVSIPVREDARDVLISAKGLSLKDLPYGARIGTSSNRRSAQLKMIRPDLNIIPIRGNVQSRIEKIEKENLDGIILAAAGLKRLGYENMIQEYFDPKEIVPAVGQGALAIEIVKGSEFTEIFKELDNSEVRLCVEAERSFMKRLDGGCHTCIGAYAFIEGKLLNITGIYDAGGNLIKKDITGNIEEAIKLGEKLADKIIS